MDGQRFDRIARAFAQAKSRREAIKLLIGGAAVATVGLEASSLDAEAKKKRKKKGNDQPSDVAAANCQAGGGGCQGSYTCSSTAPGACANPCCQNNPGPDAGYCLGDNGAGNASGRCGTCAAGSTICQKPDSNSGVCCPTTNASCDTSTGTCNCAAGFEFCGSGDTLYMSCCPTGTCNAATGACNCPNGREYCGGTCCDVGKTCSSGACVQSTCNTGQTFCQAGNKCVDDCTGGKTLNTTTCECECPAGQVDCSGTCVQVTGTGANDPSNCGACGVTCPGSPGTCVNGVCECSLTNSLLCTSTTNATTCIAGSPDTCTCEGATANRVCSGDSNLCVADSANAGKEKCVCGDSTATPAGSGVLCANPTPYCQGTGTSAECVACQLDTHCTDPTKPWCDNATGSCQPCMVDGNCTSSATPYCLIDPQTGINACVACKTDAECGGATDTCVNGTCTCDTGGNGTVCAAPTPACKSGQGSGDSVCVACLKDSDCGVGKTCNTATNTCESGCAGDQDCAGNPLGDVCNFETGKCICGRVTAGGTGLTCSGTATGASAPLCVTKAGNPADAGDATAICGCRNTGDCGGSSTFNYCSPTTLNCICGDASAGGSGRVCVAGSGEPICRGTAGQASARCGCDRDSDCPSGTVCDQNNQCTRGVECNTDADCTGDSNRCLIRETNGNICVCGSTGDNCPADKPVCDGARGDVNAVCVASGTQCQRDSDCDGDSNRCISGTCQCGSTGAACPTSAPICRGKSGSENATCVACTSDNQCEGNSNRCVSGACQCGSTGATCSGATPFCAGASGSTSAICVGCRRDGDCAGSSNLCDASNDTCVCGATGSACGGSTRVCAGSGTAAVCVQCVVDGDCPSGEACGSGNTCEAACAASGETCENRPCCSTGDTCRQSASTGLFVCEAARPDNATCAHAGVRPEPGYPCCDRLHEEKGRCAINRWDHCDPSNNGRSAHCERGTRCVGGRVSPHKTPVCVPNKKRRKKGVDKPGLWSGESTEAEAETSGRKAQERRQGANGGRDGNGRTGRDRRRD